MSHECVFVAPRPLFPSRHASNALCSHGSGPVVFCFPPTATVLVRADWLLIFCLRGLRLVLGVAVEPVHLDAIMHELDTDGDGDIVIAEFFEQMERLKLKMNAARKLALKQGEEERRRTALLQQMEEAQGTVTNAFLTILQARAGISPGVAAPKEWNRVDCDGERGVLPAKEKPWEKMKKPKDLDDLHGKTWKALKKVEKANGIGWWAGSGSDDTEGWQPPLRDLVTVVCTPSIPTEHVEFSEEDLVTFFTTLKLESQGITRMDEHIPGFASLQELSLAGNAITRIENLPPNLVQLNLSTNQLAELTALGPVGAQLHHVCLGYNQLTNATTDLEQPFPALVSLDLSHNRFTDLTDLLAKLAKLPKLNQLYLDGNPFCLRRQYRASVISALPQITMLDGVAVGVTAREVAAAYAGPDPPQPPPPADGEEPKPAEPRRVPTLAALESDAALLTVAVSDLEVITSPSWPEKVPEPAEGEEPLEQEQLELSEYSYYVTYSLTGAVDSAVTPATGVEPVEGVEWLAEDEEGKPANEGKAVATAWAGGSAGTFPHELVADVALRDALAHGRLQLNLYERRKLPLAEGEEPPAEGEEPPAPTHADQPGKLIGVGLGAVDAAAGQVALPPLEGVGLSPLAAAAPTAVAALGEAQASLKTTVSFVKPKEETRISFFAPPPEAAPVPLATMQLALSLNQEAEAPPAPVVEEDPKGKKKKKKKKK